MFQESESDNFWPKNFQLKDADLVIPVPDSARPAALGFAQELGISFDEGLLKRSI